MASLGYPIYPSDLTDAEWAELAPLLPAAKPSGQPRAVNLRRIRNGLFYLLRSGCTWRYLPQEYGSWQTLSWYFRHWRLDGTWDQIHAQLRARARLHAGRDPTPSAAIIDSQSVKTRLGGLRGYDGHKKVAGRKRHLLVDTEGFLLAVAVHPAQVPDREGGRLVLASMGQNLPRLQHIWADQGDTGTLQRWAEEEDGWSVQVIYPTWQQLKRYAPALLPEVDYAQRFHVLPRRWVVERTFSWLGRQRRLSKDYERLAGSSEAMTYLAGIRLLLTRLTRDEK